LRVDPAGVLLAVQVPDGFPLGLDGLATGVGRSLLDLLPAELSRAWADPIARCAEGQGCELDAQLDGRTFEVRLVPTPEQQVLLLVRDVTRRREDEERLRLAAALFENTHDGVLIADASWRVLAVNQAFSRITGYSRGEAIGRSADAFLRSGRDAAFMRTLEEALSEQGSWQGEIWNRRKSGEVYPQWLTILAKRDAAGEVTHYVETFSDLTGHERLEDRLGYLAHYDALTGLPNRILVHDRLERALAWAERRRSKVAVLCIDVDRFAQVNEERGQDLGDRLLRGVADVLRGVARKTDTLARFGGDEFLIVAHDIHEIEQVRRLALRVQDAIANGVDVDGESVNLSLSLGISLYPDDAIEAASLVQNAVAALAQARAQGGRAYSFFSQETMVQVQERHRLEVELEEALAQGEFVLDYQPKADLRTGRVVGTEALLRWRHPKRGLVSPLQFIPLAEETGTIVPIGAWVLEAACRQTAAWQHLGPLHVAVNLSPVQLRDPDLVAKVERALERSGLPASHLELEITESLLIEDPERAARILGTLKAMGVSFSIDDFGTGYSSLGMLRRLPVDTVKIDKSFVDDLPGSSDALEIVKAIVRMSHSLRLQVVAEGVETAEQLAVLRDNDCDLLQGFYFSRPLAPDALESFLQAPPHVIAV
jgi:diguanylate cyclase (GGDEF)-like protein/PAS domain S-box-containing protein